MTQFNYEHAKPQYKDADWRDILSSLLIISTCLSAFIISKTVSSDKTSGGCGLDYIYGYNGIYQ